MKDWQEVLHVLVEALQTGDISLGGSFLPPYSQLAVAIGARTPAFEETDPSRGLYYVEWTPSKGAPITWSLTQLSLQGQNHSEQWRWEWNREGHLLGMEFQTRFASPLPQASAHEWKTYILSLISTKST